MSVGNACFPHYLGRRPLPRVCGPASWISSFVVCSEGDVLRLPSLDHYLFSQTFGV